MAYKDPLDPRARKARRKHYHANKEQYLERNRKAKEKCKKWLRKQKDKPCTDCGQSYPYYVMDFDHKDSKLKTELVSRLVSYSLKRLKEEVKKCDLVCANCHRIRTYKDDA